MFTCTTCGAEFGSLSAFDAHRVGKYAQRGPGEYVGPLESWTRSKGRRCLTVDEMSTGDFARNERGLWSIASDLERARSRKVAA